jgi:type II secretory ATPase GspE/PulE/Tfp pilus assembly ATPase PilB-like protein
MDLQARKNLEFIFNAPIVTAIARETDISATLGELADFQSLQSIDDASPSVEIVGAPEASYQVDEHAANEPLVIRVVNKMLAQAVIHKAGDIHVELGARGLAIRFREDGIMRLYKEIPRTLQQNVIARVKVLSGMDLSEKRRPQDGRIRIMADGRHIDVRVSSVPTPSGENLVLRLLASDPSTFRFAKLGMPGSIEQAVS